MSNLLSARVPAWVAVSTTVAVVGVVAAVSVAQRAPGRVEEAPGPARGPIRVPLWVDPNLVRHQPRFRFTYDPPEALSRLREEEALDRVVAGAGGDLARFRRLVAWTRAQFEPGVPSPYPPIDARIILRDIRSGATGGFCAQYNYTLVQALQSLGHPARYVTVVEHEVAEAWARDERRWICLDPLHAATYQDESGRALSVLEIHGRALRGEPIRPGPGSLPSASDAAGNAFGRFEVWIKNDHVTRPVNFTDLARYRVRFLDPGEPAPPADLLTTREAADLYFDPEAI